MNFNAMVIEFKARGFNNMGARTEDYLRDSYMLDICEGEDWPFLEASKEGTAPLEIADLRTIEYVTNVTQEKKLQPLVKGRITDYFSPDLSTPGSPEVYYLTEGDTVNVYPVSTTDKIAVRYWKVPEELSGEKEPLMPKRWHSLVIDGAVARALTSSDDYELSTAAKVQFDTRLEQMRESLMNLQHDAPDDFMVVEDSARLR